MFRLRHCVIALSLVAVVVPTTAHASPATSRAGQFAAAAREFGVPAALLAAVSYEESRWDDHAGKPSTAGTYGPMGLADVPVSALTARGDGLARRADSPSLHTAAAAAALVGAPTDAVKRDPATNIRAGAALLRSYAGAHAPTDLAGWYPAVTRYAQAATDGAATAFADAVYADLRAGRHGDSDGGPVAIAATAVSTPAHPAPPGGFTPECPRSLGCDYVPAAYALNDPADPGSYGNYDIADRPRNVKITTIVMHDTESSYASTVNEFANPAAYVSAHYVIRSADGHVTQMVPVEDVAWHAGNWYVNTHSIGIEQEGYAIIGATWFTESLYRNSAALVSYLAHRYGVPLDRQHVIGHDNVPGITPAYVPGMHWDPGPYWDWSHFMALAGAPVRPTGRPGSPIVTIDPRFVGNLQSVTDCEGDGSATAPQAASFVWLRTAPADDAPLFADPGLWPDGGGGTTCGNDWGDKASTGQQFVVAGRARDWIAIWWDGAKVWLRSSGVVPARGFMVVPKPGVTSVATYGRAYPEASAYPATITPQAIVPLPYVITPGQGYVSGGKVPTDYYYATTFDASAPDDRTDVRGTTVYYEIQLGHRIAYVQATDVNLIPVG